RSGADELGRDPRAQPRDPAVPLAAPRSRTDRGRRPDRRGGAVRPTLRGPALPRFEPHHSRGLGAAHRGPPAGRRRSDARMSAAAGPRRDRVVVISGVGPGLGRMLALRCAEHGADVVLAARTRERLEKVAAEVESTGRRALVVPTDITDDESAAALVESAVSEFGRVDVLVN